jgi:hypothetical protein
MSDFDSETNGIPDSTPMSDLRQQIVEILRENLSASLSECRHDETPDADVEGIDEAADAIHPLLQKEWFYPEKTLPPAKEGWNHSEQVLVHYEGGETMVETFGVAYYHYNSPYAGSKWIDFHHMGRTPDRWQPINPPKQ